VSVLIVDDHEEFRNSARALLQADGYAVVGETRDGAEAIAEAERLRPEILTEAVGGRTCLVRHEIPTRRPGNLGLIASDAYDTARARAALARACRCAPCVIRRISAPAAVSRPPK